MPDTRGNIIVAAYGISLLLLPLLLCALFTCGWERVLVSVHVHVGLASIYVCDAENKTHAYHAPYLMKNKAKKHEDRHEMKYENNRLTAMETK